MNTSSIPLHLATIFACFSCSFWYIKTACFYWKSRFNVYAFSFFGACLMGTTIWGATFLNNEILSYLLFIVAELIIMWIGTYSSPTNALFAAIASTIHTMCIKGIVIGVFALILQKNLYQIITVSDRHLTAIIVTMVIKLFAPVLYRNSEVRRRFLTLFRSDKEVESVLLQHVALFIIMLFFSYNYYYNLDLIWFTMSQIILSALILVLYYITLYYGVRISNFLENEIINKRIQQQLNDKLSQYSSYQSIFKQIDDFKYHFRENILVTEELISNGSMDAAKNQLHGAIPLLLEKLPSKKVFSNNERLNALLFDWDTYCETNKIRFESKVYFPPAFEKREKEILSILAIVEDMYSYIIKSSKFPFIKAEGKVMQGNFVLSIVGSIHGAVEDRKDTPYFITPNSDSIKQLYHKLFSMSEAVDGILFWNYSAKDHTFQIMFSIHQ